MGDVVRLAHLMTGNLVVVQRHVGRDIARTYDGGADAGGASLAPEAMGQRDHRELGHGVADIGSDAPPGERTQIDHAAMTADRQMGKGSPDYAQGTLDVDPPHLFEFLLALVGDADLGIDAGGVDDGVHTAPSRDCRFDPRNRAFGVLGVVAMRHQFLALLEAAWIAKSSGYAETRFQKSIDDGASDAARGARDHHDTIVDVQHWIVSGPGRVAP